MVNGDAVKVRGGGDNGQDDKMKGNRMVRINASLRCIKLNKQVIFLSLTVVRINIVEYILLQKQHVEGKGVQSDTKLRH